MSRILLLLDNKKNRQLLRERLSSQYQVVTPEEGDGLDGEFDLGVLDGTAFAHLSERVQQRREREHPILLPFLLVTTRRDVRLASNQLWRVVDEVIITPIEANELQARVAALLRARDASQQLERQYFALADRAPIGIVVTTEEQVIYANQAFTAICRCPLEKVVGHRLRDLLYPDDRPVLQPLRPITGGVEIRLLRQPDGDTRWAVVHVTALSFPEGAFLATFQDITDRRTAEESLRQYANRLSLLHEIDRAILEAWSPEGVAGVVLRRLRRSVPYTIAAVTLFDWDEHAARAIALHGADTAGRQVTLPLDGIEDLLENMRLGRVQAIRDVLEFPSPLPPAVALFSEAGGRSIVSAPLLSRGELIGALSVGTDTLDVLTAEQIEIVREVADQLSVAIQQSRLHEQIRRYADELERRVAERTAELRLANKRLAALNRELDDFAYIVSHDLKAPLRAITQLSMWLAEDYAAVLDDDGKEKLRLLVGRTKHMHNLIEGILQYSRIGRVKEREKPVDLNALVTEIVDVLGPPEHIRVVISGELPTVVGERTRLSQVFQNLLSNAIKFMDKPEGLVEVGCKDERAYWLFSVRDNGPGIAEKYYDKIFQIFQTLRPPEQTGDVDSTGIGLSLVKKIVETWGGRVWLESTVGEGTTFYFTLPKARPSSQEERGGEDGGSDE